VPKVGMAAVRSGFKGGRKTCSGRR